MCLYGTAETLWKIVRYKLRSELEEAVRSGGHNFSFTYSFIAVSGTSDLCNHLIPQIIKGKDTPNFKKSLLLCAYFVSGACVTYSCTAVSVSPAPANFWLDLYACWSFGGSEASLWGSCLDSYLLKVCLEGAVAALLWACATTRLIENLVYLSVPCRGTIHRTEVL